MAKTVVLRWIEKREWRVAVPIVGGPVEEGYAISRAMEEAVNASGVFQSGRVDPYSIEFQIEDK